MPRDSSQTKKALIDAGRRLFATSGVFSVSVKTILAEAGQRNVSALNYHFGGRQGLLGAIIEQHNVAIEADRSMMLDSFDEAALLDDFVWAFIAPQAALLESPDGRQFLSIVSQLDDLFVEWNSPATPAHALRCLAIIRSKLPPDLSDSLTHERIVRFMTLVAEALGSRSRLLDSRQSRNPLNNREFALNLMAMGLGALSAAVPDQDLPWPPNLVESR